MNILSNYRCNDTREIGRELHFKQQSLFYLPLRIDFPSVSAYNIFINHRRDLLCRKFVFRKLTACRGRRKFANRASFRPAAESAPSLCGRAGSCGWKTNGTASVTLRGPVPLCVIISPMSPLPPSAARVQSFIPAIAKTTVCMPLPRRTTRFFASPRVI